MLDPMLYVTDKSNPHPERHNYFKKWKRMIENGVVKLEVGKSYRVDIYHDDNCNVYEQGHYKQGQYCNCDPQIIVTET